MWASGKTSSRRPRRLRHKPMSKGSGNRWIDRETKTDPKEANVFKVEVRDKMSITVWSWETWLMGVATS